MSAVFGAAQDLQQAETESAPPAEKTQKVFKAQDMPFGRILAAVMRSSAAVQGQEHVKKVTGEQAASMSKMTVTMKPNPAGGPPLVTVKDAPADFLDGRQAEDVGKAYTTPKEQVEKKISAAGLDGAATPATPQPAAGANGQPAQPSMAPRALEQAALPLDENYGFRVPRPWDADIHDPTSPDYKLGSEKKLLDIAIEMNLKDPRGAAHRAWKKLQSGAERPEQMAARIATFRANRIEQEASNLETARAPAETRANRSNIEADRLADNKRLEKQQADMERTRITAAQQNVVKQIDFTLVDDAVLSDPEQLRQYIEDRNDSGVPLTDRQLRVVQNQARQDVAADFKKFISHTEQFALADHPTWEAAKTAFGHSLSPAQEQQGRAAWQAARSYVQRTTSAADRRARTEELNQQRLLKLLSNATTEKPAEIGRAVDGPPATAAAAGAAGWAPPERVASSPPRSIDIITAAPRSTGCNQDR